MSKANTDLPLKLNAERNECPTKCTVCYHHVSNSNPKYPRSQIHIQEVEHNKNDRKGGFALRDYSNYFLNK